ncbi:MAG TPA: hypothetical protein PLO53_06390 [Candidatus Hydrogenedentes bacterium]|nr:hypothetical protein [Candidatus Hydrogenedentota bacterium]
MGLPGNISDEAIKAVREFFRRALEERYSPASLNRFAAFQELSPELLEDFRRLVLTRLYPEPSQRDALDHAFGVVTSMVSNPVKAGRAALALSRLLLFRGRHVPFLVHLSGLLMASYQDLREIECQTARAVIALAGYKKPSKNRISIQAVKRAAGTMDRSIYEKFIDRIFQITQSFANRDGWRVALDVASMLSEAFERDHTSWTDEEREATRLARQLLEESTRVIWNLPTDQIDAVADGIRTVEMEWVNTLYADISDGQNGS